MVTFFPRILGSWPGAREEARCCSRGVSSLTASASPTGQQPHRQHLRQHVFASSLAASISCQQSRCETASTCKRIASRAVCTLLSLPAVSNQPRASRRHLAASSLAASTEQSRIVSISRPAVLHSHEIDVRTVVLLCSLLLLFRRQQPATTDQPQHRQSCSSTLSIAQHRCWKRPQPLTPLHVCFVCIERCLLRGHSNS